LKSKKIFSKKIKKIFRKISKSKIQIDRSQKFPTRKVSGEQFFFTQPTKKLSGVPPIVQRVNALLAFTFKKTFKGSVGASHLETIFEREKFY
jgi:hypothetical protein